MHFCTLCGGVVGMSCFLAQAAAEDVQSAGAAMQSTTVITLEEVEQINNPTVPPTGFGKKTSFGADPSCKTCFIEFAAGRGVLAQP